VIFFNILFESMSFNLYLIVPEVLNDQ